MQTAKQTVANTPAVRAVAPMTAAMVPARVASMPIEPPHPKECRDKLEFKSAGQYKKAVLLADRYYWQAQMAVERRMASVKKAERQALVDHEETASNYQRQVMLAQTRYRTLVEQCHAKHRQTLVAARTSAANSEGVYKEALRTIPAYGELQLQVLALNDARAVTLGLVAAYKGALGPDGLGRFMNYLNALDKTIDLARDRRCVVPMQFTEALVKALTARHVRHHAADKEEVARIRQEAGARLVAIKGLLSENHIDNTPPAIRTIYFAVHEWLSKAAGTPFELAMDRLKLDIEAAVRKDQRDLENRIHAAIQSSSQINLLQPVANAYQHAQRVLLSSEQAAKNVLYAELTRVEAQLEKEVQMADAMVVGMDHTAAKRLAEAKRSLGTARKLVRAWHRVLGELEVITRWQKLIWRLTDGHEHDSYWDDLRGKQVSRHRDVV